MISASNFSSTFLSRFPYPPTLGQEKLIQDLSDFIISESSQLPLFVLEGYAGTGKTTILSVLVNILPLTGFNSVLLAPTGRSAKILSGYSGKQAYTIHKYLYFIRRDEAGNYIQAVKPNKLSNTLFIVDEASMIQGRLNSENFGMPTHDILEDLISHVFMGNNCKLLFVGDTCQLPPVGFDYSPALDKKFLKQAYFVDIKHSILNDVVRQALDSGILVLANYLRKKLDEKDATIPLFDYVKKFPDVKVIDGGDFLEALQQSIYDFGRENMVIITRSNKRANLFNKAIRERIFFVENEISAGDLVMVVRNNYYWLPEESKVGFIANGEIAEIQSLRNFEEIYGFHFADATIRLVDYPEMETIDTKILLDTLHSEGASLSNQDSNRLFLEVLADYQHLPSKREQYASVRSNPYFNALQLKHANALTCHKTQGGQWDVVFIEKGYLTEEFLNIDYLRWLYTAITRASKILYLVNFEEKFFKTKK